MIFRGSGLPKMKQKSMNNQWQNDAENSSEKICKNHGQLAQNGSKIQEQSVKKQKKGGPEIDANKNEFQDMFREARGDPARAHNPPSLMKQLTF